jgi:glyoxylase I family protein
MKAIFDKVAGICIPVLNVRRSAEWYIRVFNLDTIEITDNDAGLIFPGGAIIALWKVSSPQPTEFEAINPKKVPYYNFESYDIEHSHKALQEKGVKVSDIEEIPKVIRYFECYDLDGNLISIVQEGVDSPYYTYKEKYRHRG